MAKPKVKYLAARVTIPAGNYAVPEIVSESIELEKNYDEIEAYGVFPGDDSGVANGDYEVGLSNDNGDIVPFEPIGGVGCGSIDGCPPELRYKKFGPEPVQGSGLLNCRLKLPAQNLATDLTVVFSIKIVQNRVRTE